MKAVFIFSFLFFAASFVKAGNAELFELDEATIKAEFQQLDELEQKVLAGTELGGYTATLPPPDDYYGSRPALGIPSFIWGCCLGPTGIIITQIMTEDVNETKKALAGCAVSGCVVGGCYLLGALNSF